MAKDKEIKEMELTQAQYERIAPLLPKQRGNVRLANITVPDAIDHVAEHGCKWRGLPSRFGRWHTVDMRMYRWTRKGVLPPSAAGEAAPAGRRGNGAGHGQGLRGRRRARVGAGSRVDGGVRTLVDLLHTNFKAARRFAAR